MIKDKHELIGKQYGQWTIIDVSNKDRHGNWLARCKCSCGSIKDLQLSSVINGRSTRCRKCALEKEKEYATKRIRNGRSFKANLVSNATNIMVDPSRRITHHEVSIINKAFGYDE